MDAGNLVTTQITASMMIVMVLEYLKRAKWCTWITAQKPKLNRAIAVISAFAASVGIHFAWSMDPLSHTLLLSVSGLSLSGILHMGWDWARSFVTQELMYLVAVKPNGTAANGKQPTA